MEVLDESSTVTLGTGDKNRGNLEIEFYNKENILHVYISDVIPMNYLGM